jgi:hypothetical protein
MESEKISKDGAESAETIRDLSPEEAQAEDIKGGGVLKVARKIGSRVGKEAEKQETLGA